MDARDAHTGSTDASAQGRVRAPLPALLIGGLGVVIVVALIVGGTHPPVIGMGQTTPPAGEIWLGSSLDPSQLSLPARGATIVSGHQVAYVAHLSRPSRGDSLSFVINDAGSTSTWPADLLQVGEDVLTGVVPAIAVTEPGTITARVVDEAGDTLAAGSATIAP